MSLLNIITLAAMDGNSKGDLLNGALVSLLAIVIVFAVLLVIVLLMDVLSRVLEKANNSSKVETVPTNVVQPVASNVATVAVDINDEDMMAAVLVATIDYRQEVKEDVKVISVREIK